MLSQEIKFAKAHKLAVIPSRSHDNDVGYDLTLIGEDDHLVSTSTHNQTLLMWGHPSCRGETRIYDTGIIVIPPKGFYTQIVARSSLIKYGLIVSNGVGIIDPGYRGTLKVPLTCVYIPPTDVKFVVPIKAAQLLVVPICTPLVKEISLEEIDETSRGKGGFGSTDLI